MLIGTETAERAEAAQGPGPLGLEMLRALRALHCAEAAQKEARCAPDGVGLHHAAEAARGELEAVLGGFCAAEQPWRPVLAWPILGSGAAAFRDRAGRLCASERA